MPEIFIGELRQAYSIKVNNVFLAPDDMCKQASQCVRPVLLYHADYLDYPGLAGSATLLRHKNTNYAIVTKHQHDYLQSNGAGHGYSKLYLASLGEEIIGLSFDKIVTLTGDGDEFEQITALVISNQKSTAKDYFNHIKTRDPDEDSRDAIFSFIVGYAISESSIKYDLNSKPTITLKQVQIECVREYLYSLNEDYLETYRLKNSSVSCLNGCSGGALFSIRKQGFTHQLELDGIIVRGGGESVHVISSSIFFDFLHL